MCVVPTWSRLQTEEPKGTWADESHAYGLPIDWLIEKVYEFDMLPQGRIRSR